MGKFTDLKSKGIDINTTAQKRGYCRFATIFYVLDGTVTFESENQTNVLRAADLIVLNQGTEYQYHGSDDLMIASLEFSESVFENVCDGVRTYVGCNSAVECNEHYDQLRRLFRQMLICQLYVLEDESKYVHMVFDYYSLYYKLMETLITYFMVGNQKGTAGGAPKRVSERKEAIERYINIHYMEAVTLEAISSELYISTNYLSKFFVQSFGMSFSKYLKELRLRHAMSDLLFTGKSITQISFDNGFSGSSFFNRTFREKYGKSPTEMRKDFQKNKDKVQTKEETEQIHQRLNRLLTGEKKMTVPAASHGKNCFSVSHFEPMEHCWNLLINIGSAADIFRTDIQTHMMILSKHSRFKYARFWAPFSEELLLDINSRENDYNFLRLDRVIDRLLDYGMKPFIVFEPKLERINEDVNTVIIKSRHNMIVDDITKWRNMISAMIRHIVQKYGVEELEQWRFELPYGVYTLRDEAPIDGYMHLFKTITDVLQNYTDEHLLGGPSLPMAEAGTLRDIFGQMKALGCEPGFMSMISFAYESNEEIHKYSFLSANEDYLLTDVRMYRDILEACGFGEKPLYVTEWNQTVSDRNFINDSCYRGAYIVKNLIDVNPYISMIGYFSGTDLRTEYYDSKALLQGGNGLLTRDGILKPAAFAFELMNELGKYQIGRGSNFLITTDRRDNYFIILHNARRLGFYYFNTPEDSIEKEKIDRICEDTEPIDQEIELDDLKNGMYQIRFHKVNSEHGSILDLWKDLDYSSELSKKDTMFLQRVCEPQLLCSNAEVVKNKLRLKLHMEPNEIALAEVKLSLK